LDAEDVRVLCELIDHQARELAALRAQVETLRAAANNNAHAAVVENERANKAAAALRQPSTAAH
jgi:hypothetical protein